jgi:tetratricopeptide (TPR) repeat protein
MAARANDGGDPQGKVFVLMSNKGQRKQWVPITISMNAEVVTIQVSQVSTVPCCFATGSFTKDLPALPQGRSRDLQRRNASVAVGQVEGDKFVFVAKQDGKAVVTLAASSEADRQYWASALDSSYSAPGSGAPRSPGRSPSFLGNRAGAESMRLATPVGPRGIFSSKSYKISTSGEPKPTVRLDVPEPPASQPDQEGPGSSNVYDQMNERYQELLRRQRGGPEWRQNPNEVLQEGLALYQFLGEFLQTAARTAEVIVNEYCLPSSLKTIRPLLSEEIADDDVVRQDSDQDLGGLAGRGADKRNESKEQLYLYRGLLFRLTQSPAVLDDRDPDEKRLKHLSITDAAHHKILSVEELGAHWTSEVVFAVAQDEENDPEAEHERADFCTPLSCLVDYQGFRIQVITIPPVEEESTLVYGRVNVTSPFCDKDHFLRGHLAKVGRRMNLEPHSYSPRNDSDAYASPNHVVLISLDSQVHRCADGRYYMLNLSRIFPPELASSSSNHLATHVFRPEFLTAFPKQLSADAYRSDLGEAADREGHERQAAAASSYLIEEVVPALAGKLDNLVELPYDSYTLTEAVHNNGLNMRHLGPLFSACEALYAKIIVCTEAVARSCKRLCTQVQRRILRKGRAMTLAAELRGRSGENDFRDFNAAVAEDLKKALAEFVNLVIGKSPESDQLWRDTLPPLLKMHFRLDAPSDMRSSLIILPQLLAALEFHLGFSLNLPLSGLDMESASPISPEHIKLRGPRLKWKDNRSILLVSMAMRADEFCAEGNHSDAVRAYSLRVALQKMAKGNVTPDLVLQRTLLSQAQCHLHMRHFSESLEACQSASADLPASSPLRGVCRMVMMGAHYRLGEREAAMLDFEAARQIFTSTLGQHHPVVCQLMALLADLYFEEESYAPATITLRQAEEFVKKTLGNSHVLCALYSYKLGCSLALMGETTEAIAAMQRSLGIYELLHSKGTDQWSSMATCQLALSELLGKNGRVQEAVSLAKQCMEINESRLQSRNQSQLLSAYLHLAHLSELENKTDASIHYLEKYLLRRKLERVPEAVRDIQLVTRRLLRLLLQAQPFQVRTLLESLSKSMLTHVDPTVANKVFTYLFDESPKAYFEDLIFQVPEITVAGIPGMMAASTRSSLPPGVSPPGGDDDSSGDRRSLSSRRGTDDSSVADNPRLELAYLVSLAGR